MEKQHYPSLYQQSNSLALVAKRKHIRFTMLKILILIGVATTTSISWTQESALGTQGAIVLTILLVLSISLTAIMSLKRYDRVWFANRMIAESVKTETWGFMMRAGHYQRGPPNSKAENRFYDSLKQILNQQSHDSSFVDPGLHGSGEITENMMQIRNETLENRLVYYVQNRIRDQITWYAQKAQWNRTQESRWFVITWILEVLTVVIAVLMISHPVPIINPVGLVMAMGAGVLSWINARSYSEPAQSYGHVAQELKLFEGRAKNVGTDNELAAIVRDVEETIRREHSVWAAKLL